MKIVHATYALLSYLIMMPWMALKCLAFIVFVISMAFLAMFSALIKGDVKSVYMQFKHCVKEEYHLLKVY